MEFNFEYRRLFKAQSILPSPSDNSYFIFTKFSKFSKLMTSLPLRLNFENLLEQWLTEGRKRKEENTKI